MSKITIIGIELAKNVFHLHAVASTGRQVKVIKLSRLKLTEYLHRSEPTTVAMEACASAITGVGYASCWAMKST